MWSLPLCMLMHRPLLCRFANLKEISEKLKCISNLKKSYTYLKKLQIFFFENCHVL